MALNLVYFILEPMSQPQDLFCQFKLLCTAPVCTVLFNLILSTACFPGKDLMTHPHGVMSCAGTPDADQALFEEILIECTAFQLAGALSEDAIREAVNDVTEAVLREGSSSSSTSSSREPFKSCSHCSIQF